MARAISRRGCVGEESGPSCDRPEQRRVREASHGPTPSQSAPPQATTSLLPTTYGCRYSLVGSARGRPNASCEPPDVAKRQRFGPTTALRPLTIKLIDAAQLAATAPPGGVLPPADETAELTYLDLRADCPSVAASKARAVATAFGPSLYLRASLRLVVACGELRPSTVAGWFAPSNQPANEGQIAVVHGEDLIERLEELMLAGCELGAMEPPPVAAWAPASVPCLHDAVATGASVIVSRFAAPAHVAEAVDVEASARTPVIPETTPIDLVYVDHYECVVEGPSLAGLEAALGRIPEALKATCTTTMAEHGESIRLSATAKSYTELSEFAKRLELLSPAGMLQRPTVESITPRYRREETEIPTRLVEHAVEARSANEWGSD